MKMKKSEMMIQERNQERKFSRVGPSSGKRTRESQVESVYSYATRGRSQGPTMTQGSCRGPSTGQGERLEWPHCHKYHSGTCRRITGRCFQCE